MYLQGKITTLEVPAWTNCLPRPEVEGLVRLKKSALYRLLNDPDSDFPRPLKIGPKAIRWRRSEINEWLSSRPRAGDEAA